MYASIAGLDTGCCYGFKLTACIVPEPPKRLLSRVLAHLKPPKPAAAAPPGPRAGRQGFAGSAATGVKNGAAGATLESLGAILLSVESKHTYEDVVRY